MPFKTSYKYIVDLQLLSYCDKKHQKHLHLENYTQEVKKKHGKQNIYEYLYFFIDQSAPQIENEDFYRRHNNVTRSFQNYWL